MRNFILATLLVTTAGCASARRSWHSRYDQPRQHLPADSNLSSGFRNPPPLSQPPVDVSRSTESGPSGGAGVGPRAN